LLTQHLPSPRAVGHRWDSEINPLRHNWFGRKVSDANVHGYAMNRFGTRVWGWEMPWWGRDEGDPARNSRQLGREYARAFLATLDRLESKAAPPVDAPVVEGAGRCTSSSAGRRSAESVSRCGAGRRAPSVGQDDGGRGHDGGDTCACAAAGEEGEWRYWLRERRKFFRAAACCQTAGQASSASIRKIRTLATRTAPFFPRGRPAGLFTIPINRRGARSGRAGGSASTSSG
jgi:hypothetical protein